MAMTDFDGRAVLRSFAGGTADVVSRHSYDGTADILRNRIERYSIELLRK